MERGSRKMADQYDERVASLEASYTSLHKDVSRLADSVGDLGRDFRKTMDVLNNKLIDSRRTPWGVLASWSGVVLVIFGIIGSFYIHALQVIASQTNAQEISLDLGEQRNHEREIKFLERIHKIEIRQAQK